MLDVEQILRAGKERRAAERKRRETVESFRKATERSVALAIGHFVMAASQGTCAVFLLSSQDATHYWNVLLAVMLGGVAGYYFTMGVRRLWVSPRDQLLLLMLEEVLEKKDVTSGGEQYGDAGRF